MKHNKTAALLGIIGILCLIIGTYLVVEYSVNRTFTEVTKKNISKIKLQSGENGVTVCSTDVETIQKVKDLLNEVKYKRKFVLNQKKGWTYRLFLYEDGKEKITYTITFAGTLSYIDGKVYTMDKSTITDELEYFYKDLSYPK